MYSLQVEAKRSRSETEALVLSGEARVREMAARADEEEARLNQARRRLEADEER